MSRFLAAIFHHLHTTALSRPKNSYAPSSRQSFHFGRDTFRASQQLFWIEKNSHIAMSRLANSRILSALSSRLIKLTDVPCNRCLSSKVSSNINVTSKSNSKSVLLTFLYFQYGTGVLGLGLALLPLGLD